MKKILGTKDHLKGHDKMTLDAVSMKKSDFSTLFSFNQMCMWLRKLEILIPWTRCLTLVPSLEFEPRMKEILSTKDCLKGRYKIVKRCFPSLPFQSNVYLVKEARNEHSFELLECQMCNFEPVRMNIPHLFHSLPQFATSMIWTHLKKYEVENWLEESKTGLRHRLY